MSSRPGKAIPPLPSPMKRPNKFNVADLRKKDAFAHKVCGHGAQAPNHERQQIQPPRGYEATEREANDRDRNVDGCSSNVSSGNNSTYTRLRVATIRQMR